MGAPIPPFETIALNDSPEEIDRARAALRKHVAANDKEVLINTVILIIGAVGILVCGIVAASKI